MVQHTIVQENLLESFQPFLHYYEASRLDCGVILARAELSEARLARLQTYMEEQEPQTAAQFRYDPKGTLGILLDDRKIGYTHFYALFVKDFLETRGLLKSSVYIASFPESGVFREQMLSAMIRELMSARDERRDIRLFHQHFAGDQTTVQSVLIVDNDAQMREWLGRHLGKKGYEVHHAADGKEGMEKVEALKPDIAIMELNLPVMGGYSFMQRMRSDGLLSRTKLLVLTYKRREEDIRRSFEFGASDYMTKPFSLVELEERIKKILSA